MDYIMISVRILHGFNGILKDSYEDSTRISIGALRGYYRIPKGTLKGFSQGNSTEFCEDSARIQRVSTGFL